MSPWEGHQKKAKPGHNYTYRNPASLSKSTCESANPRLILRRRFYPASGKYAFSASALGEKIHLPLGPCGSALRASENVGQRPFLPLSVV